MEKNTWLRRTAARSRQPGRKAEPVKFRSDNDLYAWRLTVTAGIPITGLAYGALEAFHVPFRYSPAAIIPAVILGGVMQFVAWRDRKLGRRFSQYDADDLDR